MRYWNKTLLASLLLVAVPVMAESSFVVSKIIIEGNHRISDGTILNYLPIHVGDNLQPSDTAKIIQALYKTNFFTKHHKSCYK